MGAETQAKQYLFISAHVIGSNTIKFICTHVLQGLERSSFENNRFQRIIFRKTSGFAN